MKESIEEIEIQLISYFSGELTNDERLKIDNWRKLAPENEKIFQEMHHAWTALPLLNEMEQFNSFEALKKVDSQLNNQSKIKWMVYLQRIAAVLIIPILFFTAYLAFQNSALKQLYNKDAIIQTVTSRQGMISYFKLADGTQVWLNSGSTLEFPLQFTGEKREVKLTGEAYFDVTKNEKQAFLLHSKDLNVEVLGTSFNVVSYDDELVSEVTLVSGKVKLSTETNHQITDLGFINPGEKAVYTKNTHKVNTQKVEVDKYVAWREGNLIFREDSMSEVVNRLSHWFNIEISVVDPEIKDYIYTARFSNETLSQVLYLLKISAPIDYKIIERKATANGGFAKQKVLLMKKRRKEI